MYEWKSINRNIKGKDNIYKIDNWLYVNLKYYLKIFFSVFKRKYNIYLQL